jgi:penicillin-binding protein 1A
LWKALAHSINTIAVKLMVEVGRKTVEATAHRVGITGLIDPYPTMAIGTSALTLIDMATGYATFAAGGKLARPYAVLEIHKPNGELIYSHAANENDSPQVDPYDKVAELNSMMHDVVMSGTATRAQLGYAPVAGKTGTNASYRDAWFLGFTAHNVTGVWVGNDDNTSMDGSKANAVTGGRVPAPAWKRIMDVAEIGFKPEGLPGVPLDDSYTPQPTLIPDIPVSSAPATPMVLPSVDEVASVVDNSTEPNQDATNVLNGMFNLFEKTPDEAPVIVSVATQPKPAAVPRKPRPGLVLPKVNTTAKKRPNFFDQFFANSGKKSKHKTIFGF